MYKFIRSHHAAILTIVIFLLIFGKSVGAEDCYSLENKGKVIQCLQGRIEKLEKANLPIGVVIMWAGELSDMPDGWRLCDGKDGRPDLVHRFVIGAGPGGLPTGTSGGSGTHDHGGSTQNHNLSAAELPAHNHKLGTGSGDCTTMVPGGAAQRLAHFKTDQFNGSIIQTTHLDGGGGQGHLHGISKDKHLPPYYALAFIIKATN